MSKKIIDQDKSKTSKSTKTSVSYTTVINPATSENIGKVKNTDLKTISKKISQARKAQSEWKDFSFKKRATYLKKIQNYIIDHAEELSQIVSHSTGKTRIDALATEVIPCALAARWYRKNTEKHLKPKKISTSSILFLNKRSQLIRLPLGVVGVISPWNYPLSIPLGEIFMALMAGNAVVLKVATESVDVGKAIEKIINSAGLPKGLFHYLVGSGSVISKAMFENGIDKIFFTGSVATGKLLMKEASKTLTPLSLELGGKDPMIVFEDADLERAANGAAWAGYQNAGQSCAGIERIYVQESIYDKFVELLAEKTRMIRHGFDKNFEVEMGSMTTKKQASIVDKHVKSAVKKGARIVATSQADGKLTGYFYPATLIVDVDHTMDLMTKETFGPVLPVMKFKTEKEAIDLANDSIMALTSSVWSRNIPRARRFAAKLESGVTTVNDHLYTHGLSETPWGGWKQSGLGHTHSTLGIEEMTNVKIINWDILNSHRNLWWFPFSKQTYTALLAGLNFAFPSFTVDYLKSFLSLARYSIKKMFSPWKNS